MLGPALQMLAAQQMGGYLNENANPQRMRTGADRLYQDAQAARTRPVSAPKLRNPIENLGDALPVLAALFLKDDADIANFAQAFLAGKQGRAGNINQQRMMDYEQAVRDRESDYSGLMGQAERMDQRAGMLEKNAFTMQENRAKQATTLEGIDRRQQGAMAAIDNRGEEARALETLRAQNRASDPLNQSRVRQTDARTTGIGLDNQRKRIENWALPMELRGKIRLTDAQAQFIETRTKYWPEEVAARNARIAALNFATKEGVRQRQQEIDLRGADQAFRQKMGEANLWRAQNKDSLDRIEKIDKMINAQEKRQAALEKDIATIRTLYDAILGQERLGRLSAQQAAMLKRTRDGLARKEDELARVKKDLARLNEASKKFYDSVEDFQPMNPFGGGPRDVRPDRDNSPRRPGEQPLRPPGKTPAGSPIKGDIQTLPKPIPNGATR